jgi:hypothetical protein
VRANQVRRGTLLGGLRVERISDVVQHGTRMVRVHLADTTTRDFVPGAEVPVAHTRRLELEAGPVPAQMRTEIVAAVMDSQTPRSNGRRGLSTTRRTS